MPPVHAHESDRAIPRMRRGVAHPERGSAWHPTSDGASHFFRFSCSPTNPTCEGQLHQFPLELWRRAGRILRPLLNSGENLGMHYENETRQRSVCSVPRAAPRSTSAVTTSMRLGTGPRSRGRQAIVPGGPEPLTSERGRHQYTRRQRDGFDRWRHLRTLVSATWQIGSTCCSSRRLSTGLI